jgi:hypothetical protein
VDKVDIRKDQYHINSTGTLGTVFSTVLADQKLLRESIGAIKKKVFLLIPIKKSVGILTF